MFFFSSRRRHTRYWRDWSSDVCSSDLGVAGGAELRREHDGDAAGTALVRVRTVPRDVLLPAAEQAADVSVGEGARSEERRVGKECSSRWSPYPEKKKWSTKSSDGEHGR